ncbi:MAG: hypothetical protein AVDCRST_MAG80-1405, partial [uncultured Rubrobacteraceae bacterium]
ERRKPGESGCGVPCSFPAQQGFVGDHLRSRGAVPRRPRGARRSQRLAVYRRVHPVHVLCRGVPADSPLRPLRPLPSLAPLRTGCVSAGRRSVLPHLSGDVGGSVRRVGDERQHRTIRARTAQPPERRVARV